jgi:hypothetical protein
MFPDTPLKVTELAPRRLVPLIVITVPTGPLVGVNVVMVGQAASEALTGAQEEVVADAAPFVRALAAAKEIVVSPPNNNDPARAVRKPRRMPLFIGLPHPQGPLNLLAECLAASSEPTQRRDTDSRQVLLKPRLRGRSTGWEHHVLHWVNYTFERLGRV